MKVYFDTNVFDHIFKKLNLLQKDLDSLANAIKASKFSILLSTLNIEEMISIIKSSNKYPANEMELLLNLTDWEEYGFIKSYNEIIKEDIDYFLNIINAPEYMHPSTVIYSNQQFLLSPNLSEKNEFNDIVIKVQKQKEILYRMFLNYKNKVKCQIKDLRGQYPSFEEFKKEHIQDFAFKIFNQIGQVTLDIKNYDNKILNIKSIKLYTETSLSLIYSYLFKKRCPCIGDSRDLLHSILATPADIFVTNDKQYLTVLRRFTINGIRFLNLKDFILEFC